MKLKKPVSIGVHLQSRANEVPGTQHLGRGEDARVWTHTSMQPPLHTTQTVSEHADSTSSALCYVQGF